jgi:fatty-acyl-CoA synthase
VQTRIRIVDERDRPAGTDQVGEILVRGPQVMAGYWGEPEETARVLRDGWLHTGDLGSVDAEGYLTVVDRKHGMIISGGLNVYPAEIERVLAEVAGVTELAAVGWNTTAGARPSRWCSTPRRPRQRRERYGPS